MAPTDRADSARDDKPGPGEDRPGRKPIDIAPDVPHPARVYDYVAGGNRHFSVDRAAVEHATAVADGGFALAHYAVEVHQEFVQRVVRHLAADAGIRQFLDIGSGIPTRDNTHEVAQRVAPESRVVYADSDPVVLAHAHELRRSTPEGATAFLDVDVRAPHEVLALAPATLDLDEPVAVMLLGVLYHVVDEDGPYGIVSTLMDAVPPGSYLVLSHLASDIMSDVIAEAAKRIDEATGFRLVLRTHAEVVRFFDGLDLLEPGVVPADEWRPDRHRPRPPGWPADWLVPFYGGVARKP